MAEHLPSEEILPCPKCNGPAFQSADMEFVHPKSNEFRSLYYWHCFEGDCGFSGPKSYSDPESGKLWNSHVQEYKADQKASEDAFHARLP